MAVGSRLVSDVLRIMRLAIARRNTNDPDSSDATLFSYINDFVSLSMVNDIQLFSEFGTLTFDITAAITSGVYTFNDVGADSDFMSISNEAFISLAAPANASISWNRLEIYRNPQQFFSIWGVNNQDVLVAGYPTEVLFYGNELTFRTIPDVTYQVQIYGYKKANDYGDTTDALQFDYWLRYLAYGSALNYVRDYNYSTEKISMIQNTFSYERKLLLNNTHNKIKLSRATPRF